MANEESTTKRKAEDQEPRPKKTPKTKEDFIKHVNRLSLDDFMSLHASESSLQYTYKPRSKGRINPSDILAFDVRLKEVPGSNKGTTLAQTIKDAELEECFDLIKLTSEDAYRPSSFGWHPTRKKREMRERDMRYLLVRRRHKEANSSPNEDDTKQQHAAPTPGPTSPESALPDEQVKGPIEGFASFMLTYEDGHPVVYIYEIHISPPLQNIGLGAHLLRVMESIGRSVGVDKAMLTVFRSNESGREFYRKVGYGVDKYSPKNVELRGGVVRQADYMIMSKWLREVEGGKQR